VDKKLEKMTKKEIEEKVKQAVQGALGIDPTVLTQNAGPSDIITEALLTVDEAMRAIMKKHSVSRDAMREISSFATGTLAQMFNDEIDNIQLSEEGKDEHLVLVFVMWAWTALRTAKVMNDKHEASAQVKH